MLYIGQLTVGTEALVSDAKFTIPDLAMPIPNQLSAELRSLCVTHGLTLRIDYGKGALLLTTSIVFPVVFSAVRRNLVHAYNYTEHVDPTTTKARETSVHASLRVVANAIVDVISTSLSLFKAEDIRVSKTPRY